MRVHSFTFLNFLSWHLRCLPWSRQTNVSEHSLDNGVSPSPEFADWLLAWHSVPKRPEGMGGSTMQVAGGGEGGCLSVCWRRWGSVRQHAECTEPALTTMVSREWNSAAHRAVPRVWEPAVHLMNSSHLLSSHLVLRGEKHTGVTDSVFLTGLFSAHLHQSFLQTSAAVNVTWMWNRCNSPEPWTSRYEQNCVQGVWGVSGDRRTFWHLSRGTQRKQCKKRSKALGLFSLEKRSPRHKHSF